MKKGWRLDLAFVERRERIAKERLARAVALVMLQAKVDADRYRLEQDIHMLPRYEVERGLYD